MEVREITRAADEIEEQQHRNKGGEEVFTIDTEDADLYDLTNPNKSFQSPSPDPERHRTRTSSAPIDKPSRMVQALRDEYREEKKSEETELDDRRAMQSIMEGFNAMGTNYTDEEVKMILNTVEKGNHHTSLDVAERLVGGTETPALNQLAASAKEKHLALTDAERNVVDAENNPNETFAGDRFGDIGDREPAQKRARVAEKTTTEYMINELNQYMELYGELPWIFRVLLETPNEAYEWVHIVIEAIRSHEVAEAKEKMKAHEKTLQAMGKVANVLSEQYRELESLGSENMEMHWDTFSTTALGLLNEVVSETGVPEGEYSVPRQQEGEVGAKLWETKVDFARNTWWTPEEWEAMFVPPKTSKAETQTATATSQALVPFYEEADASRRCSERRGREADYSGPEDRHRG